jgi:hypothetical protein
VNKALVLEAFDLLFNKGADDPCGHSMPARGTRRAWMTEGMFVASSFGEPLHGNEYSLIRTFGTGGAGWLSRPVLG